MTEFHCLNCRAEMNTFASLGGIDYSTPGPAAGDLAICLQCGGVMKLDNNGLRPMSKEEWDEITADKNFMRVARQLVAEAVAISRAMRRARDN